MLCVGEKMVRVRERKKKKKRSEELLLGKESVSKNVRCRVREGRKDRVLLISDTQSESSMDTTSVPTLC